MDVRARALLRGHGYDPDEAHVLSDLDAWFRIAVWEGFTFDAPEMLARLEATLAEFRPDVCYIDVLRKVTLRDLNKAAEASSLTAEMDRFRRRHNVLFRVLHHYRKVQGYRAGRGSQEIGGSFVLGAWGENSLFFEPVGRKQGAVHVEVQTKDGPPVPGFRLKIESEGPAHAPTLVRLTVTEETGPNTERDEAIFQAVASLPVAIPAEGEAGVSPKTIAEALKRSEKTVKRSLDRLIEANRVVVTGTTVRLGKLYRVNDP